MFQKMFLGPQGEIVDEVKQHGHGRGIRDLNWREIAIMVPILILIFWIGLYPKPFFTLMAPAVDQLVQNLSNVAVAMH
jgi:NADH-quinone oxidoreductase subunit M